MTQMNNALVKKSGQDTGPGEFLRAPLSLPAADVSETDEAYMLSLDMPGAQREAIRVTVVDGILVVRAPIAPIHGEGAAVLYREIPTGAYERRFTLGDGIDRNNVDASFRDGVLTISLPKAEEARPKQIDVKVK